MSVINFEFRNEVLHHNASLSYCYQCSTCSGGCPIALMTNGSYNPRKIIEMAILGFQNRLVENKGVNIWQCSTCQKCVELCPQKVELTEIFTIIKNKGFVEGKCPESFIAQGQAIADNGVAIPYSNAILSRRRKLGLPEVKTAAIEEIDNLLTKTKFKNYLKREGG